MTTKPNPLPENVQAVPFGPSRRDLDHEHTSDTGWQMRVWTAHPRSSDAWLICAVGCRDQDTELLDAVIQQVLYAHAEPWVSIASPSGIGWVGTLVGGPLTRGEISAAQWVLLMGRARL